MGESKKGGNERWEFMEGGKFVRRSALKGKEDGREKRKERTEGIDTAEEGRKGGLGGLVGGQVVLSLAPD